MAKEHVRLDRLQVEQLRGLRRELTKVRCWLSGYESARDGNLRHQVPGKDGLRMLQILIDDILSDADKKK